MAIIKFIIGALAGISLVLIFPSIVTGIVLLVISPKEKEPKKKKYKKWGLILIVSPFAVLFLSLISFVIVSIISKIIS